MPATVDRAALHVAEQQDRAAAILERARLDDAGVVDHGPEQLAGGLRGQQHLAAIGADQAAIVDQRVDRACVDRDVEQAVAGDVERDRLAGGERDVPRCAWIRPWLLTLAPSSAT